MKLLTKAIENSLLKHPLCSTDGMPAENRKVLVKFFTPDSSYTWYVLEAEFQKDGDWMFFGLVDSGRGEQEFGYFTLSQLKVIRGNYRLPVERDRGFSGKLSEVQT